MATLEEQLDVAKFQGYIVLGANERIRDSDLGRAYLEWCREHGKVSSYIRKDTRRANLTIDFLAEDEALDRATGYLTNHPGYSWPEHRNELREPAREVVRRYGIETKEYQLHYGWWNVNRVPADQAEQLMRDILAALPKVTPEYALKAIGAS